jgi:PAS domain S-box-containing protein
VLDSIGRPLLQSIEALTGVSVRTLPDLPSDVQHVALEHVLSNDGAGVCFSALDGRYIGCRYDPQRVSIVVAGPYVLCDDPLSDHPRIDDDEETRLRIALESAARGLKELTSQQRTQLEVASQFELMSSAVIAITGDLSLDNVLNRIVDLARSVAGARYAALGVPGPDGDLEKFIVSGLTPEEQAAIGELPKWRGLLGVLLREKTSLRIREISSHPASVGFPENHPPMHSFLGVPIVARGRVLGNLYLTEKRFGAEFTTEDEQMVELLARHVAVAIENARLYEHSEQQEERLRFMIDQLPEAVVLVEPNPERITLANRQASLLLGWDLTTPVSLWEFLDRNRRFGQDGQRLRDDDIPAVRSLRYGETVMRSEISLTRDDGEHLTLLVNAAPLRQADGTVTAATIVFQDISKLKDAEQLKDDFLSLVSHELRTPLTTIHGGSHLLRESGMQLDEQSRKEILDDILSESKRLADLVENMVQLANIRAGRFQITDEPVHVRLLIDRALRSVNDTARGREIRIHLDRDLFASGDTESLDQVLRNLLQNAVKYVPDHSPIDITAGEHDGMVVVSVRDYGKGVDPSDIPLLFDRFQRGREKVTTAGMGLGLYLSRMLVEAHGGQLWLELPEGGGSRFSFSVPKAPAE